MAIPHWERLLSQARRALERGQTLPMVRLLSGELTVEQAGQLVEAIGEGPALRWLRGRRPNQQLLVAIARVAERPAETLASPDQLRAALDLEREREILASIAHQRRDWWRVWGAEYGFDLLDRHGVAVLQHPDIVIGLLQRRWAPKVTTPDRRTIFPELTDVVGAEDFVASQQQLLRGRVDDLLARERDGEEPMDTDMVMSVFDLALNQASNMDLAEKLIAFHGDSVWAEIGRLAREDAAREGFAHPDELDKMKTGIERHLGRIKIREPDYRPDARELAVCIAQMSDNPVLMSRWTAGWLTLSLLKNRAQSRRPTERLISADDIDDVNDELLDFERKALALAENERRAELGRVVEITESDPKRFFRAGDIGICVGAGHEDILKVFWPWSAGQASLTIDLPYRLRAARAELDQAQPEQPSE